MMEENFLEILCGSDDKAAYALFRQMNAESAESDVYYPYFDEFFALAHGSNSFIRTRGFALCCAQARWDRDGKLDRALPNMIAGLRTEKPTAVRQCLKALHEVVLYRGELDDTILSVISDIDPQSFGESMGPLIEKDIKELQKMIFA